VYQAALRLSWRQKRSIRAPETARYTIYNTRQSLGRLYSPDLVCFDRIIVELKRSTGSPEPRKRKYLTTSKRVDSTSVFCSTLGSRKAGDKALDHLVRLAAGADTLIGMRRSWLGRLSVDLVVFVILCAVCGSFLGVIKWMRSLDIWAGCRGAGLAAAGRDSRRRGRAPLRRLNDKQVFIMGNGGSAATARTLRATWQEPRHPRPAALPRHGPHRQHASVLALANDYGYEHVFAEQLANLVRQATS